MVRKRNRRNRCASAPYKSSRLDGLNVLNHLNDSSSLDLAFQNLQPIIPVNEKKFAVLHVEDVVAVDGVLSLATGAIKNVTALF